MRKQKYEVLLEITLVYMCFVMLVMSFPMRAEAAIYEDQETKVSLVKEAVGRYQINYTGNTNHFAGWVLQADPADTYPVGNVIYNDVPGFDNSSTAALTQTPGASGIKHAFLVWETRALQGAKEPVYFIGPGGGQWVYPTYAINDWREIGRGRSIFCMATDVTDFVRNAGYGNYSVCNIPRWTPTWDDNGGGESPGSWQLIVVEEGDDFPVRAVALSMGSEFRMGKDYAGDLTLTNGIKTKSNGTVTGQVFFGGSNSSSSAPMTQEVSSYGDYGYIKNVISSTTYAPGLYRNGTLVNGRDYGNGCIRMDLSDVSNMGNSARRIHLDVKNTDWSSFFFLGLAADIAYPDFNGTQTTIVQDPDTVAVEGQFTNTATTPNTGIYNGKMVVAVDAGLMPTSAAAIVDGVMIQGSISGNIVTYEGTAVASMMNGSQISYHVQCRVKDSAKRLFQNSAVFHGRLRSDGVNTGYWIDKMWTAHSQAELRIYNVTLHAGTGINPARLSGAGSYMEMSPVVVGAETREGYHWVGWSGDFTSAEKNYSFLMPGRNITLTANGEANTYQVHFNGNSHTGGSMEDIMCTYDRGTKLPANTFSKTGYTFTGWNTKADGSGITYGDQADVKNLTTVDKGTIHLYAQWRANQYTLRFHPNDGGEAVPLEALTLSYDTKATLPNGADYYRKYTLDGVNVTEDVLNGTIVLNDAGVVVMMMDEATGQMVDVYGNPFVESGEAETVTASAGDMEVGTVTASAGDTEAGTVTASAGDMEAGTVTASAGDMEAGTDVPGMVGIEEIWSEAALQSGIDADVVAQDGGTEMAAESQDSDIEMETAPRPDKKAYESVFMGWSFESERNSLTPQWIAGEPVSVSALTDAAGITDTDGAEITLYAIWDDCPWITAANLYYTMEQAKSGIITEQEILSHATASDREDGSPIFPGFHENGTSFSIPDYQVTDFTQFTKDGSCTENLTVVDSVGSMYTKQITVHVVDTAAVAENPQGATRFIDEHFYGQPCEYGGLEEVSVWKKEPEYATLLRETFSNLRNNTPIETYYYTHETILAMKAYVREHGIGRSREPGALQNFYARFMAPNRVT